LYSGRLAHPGTPHAQAAAGAEMAVTIASTTALFLNDISDPPCYRCPTILL
jgi:hypothetical protein